VPSPSTRAHALPATGFANCRGGPGELHRSESRTGAVSSTRGRRRGSPWAGARRTEEEVGAHIELHQGARRCPGRHRRALEVRKIQEEASAIVEGGSRDVPTSPRRQTPERNRSAGHDGTGKPVRSTHRGGELHRWCHVSAPSRGTAFRLGSLHMGQAAGGAVPCGLGPATGGAARGSGGRVGGRREQTGEGSGMGEAEKIEIQRGIFVI
jgi:hypothetical protein